MIARGFKPMGWVAAVGGAALGCYMLSLQVATERSELARVEREIIATKQQIRSLQTELGTRGRLSQLEHWNAEVLALSAPGSGQFLENSFTLARFDQNERPFEERAAVRLASADAAPAAPATPKPAEPGKEEAAPPAPRTVLASAEAEEPRAALVHRASLPTTAQGRAEAKPERAPRAKPDESRPTEAPTETASRRTAAAAPAARATDRTPATVRSAAASPARTERAASVGGTR